MCGIVGIVYNNNLKELEYIHGMILALKHRGPDDEGILLDQDSGIAFGHRRLSIIDLSKAGHQPMHSATGRYLITYNGEIYNYLDLKKDLIALGFNFIGHSDTEVILAAIEHWGLEKALQKFNGMFAFALWDRKDKKLYLARDRFGEKPLYYGWINGSLIFASELKALRQYKSWPWEINRDILAVFLRYSYIPAPDSIYKNIFKIKPGSIIEFSADKKQKYYSYWDAVAEAKKNILVSKKNFTEDDIIEQLHDVLLKSVREKCISDVPLGVFLSSGIDSSLITALMQEYNKTPIKTFTIGFNEKYFNNEAPNAAKIAKYLGTEHYELYVTEAEAKEVIPKLPNLYDEPFADSSQLPTYLVSAFARNKITVCLSGDGGDEVFGGYNRYIWLRKLYENINWLPNWAIKIGKFIGEERWDLMNRMIFSRLLPRKKQVAFLGQKINKVLHALQHSKDLAGFYANIISVINNSNDFLIVKNNSEIGLLEAYNNDFDFIQWMMLADTINYLPGDILTKVDRAAMGVGLETRAPYLDKNVFDFAWQLSSAYKIHNSQGKYILRKLLAKYIPQDLIEKPKVGFGVPIGLWLKNDLRPWAEDLLSENGLKKDNIFAADLVRIYWSQHLSGKYDWSYLLWNFLMFQAWFRENK